MVSHSFLARYDQFAASLHADVPAAFVLGAERAHGLAFSRSLGRRGIPVVTLGRPGTPGLRSRYGFPVVLESSSDDRYGKGMVDLLCRLGEKLPTPGVLLATGDAHVLMISRNRERLAQQFEFTIADREILETLADKQRQYAFASKCGIPIPRTLSPEGAEALKAVPAEIGFPCVIKPAFSHAWQHYQIGQGLTNLKKLEVVSTPRELLCAHSRMTAGNQRVIIQELIPGGADQLHAVYAYCPARFLAKDRSAGQSGGWASELFVRHEIRDWPVEFGNGSYSTGVIDSEVESLGRKLLACTGYLGLANIEFKRDLRDGTLKLIEFNVRAASQTALAVDSGIDLPFAVYADLTGTADIGAAPKPVRQGVRWIDFGADIFSGREHIRRGGLGFFSWLLDLLRARSFAYFAIDDLMPALVRTTEIARSLFNLSR